MNEFGYVDYSLKSSLVFRNRPLCDLAVKEERKRESERSLEKGGLLHMYTTAQLAKTDPIYVSTVEKSDQTHCCGHSFHRHH